MAREDIISKELDGISKGNIQGGHLNIVILSSPYACLHTNTPHNKSNKYINNREKRDREREPVREMLDK